MNGSLTCDLRSSLTQDASLQFCVLFRKILFFVAACDSRCGIRPKPLSRQEVFKLARCVCVSRWPKEFGKGSAADDATALPLGRTGTRCINKNRNLPLVYEGCFCHANAQHHETAIRPMWMTGLQLCWRHPTIKHIGL